LCIQRIPDNRFTTLNQQNAQSYSIDIYIIIPYLIILHVSIRKNDVFGLPLYEFVRIPDDGPLRTDTCKDIKCDIVIWISKQQVCASCWFSVVEEFKLWHCLSYSFCVQWTGISMPLFVCVLSLNTWILSVKFFSYFQTSCPWLLYGLAIGVVGERSCDHWIHSVYLV